MRLLSDSAQGNNQVMKNTIPTNGIKVNGGGAKNKNDCIKKIKMKYTQANGVIYNSKEKRCWGYLYHTTTEDDPTKSWDLYKFPAKTWKPLEDGKYGSYCMDLRYDVYPDASERISFGTAPSMKVCINKARKNKEVNAVIWGRFKECHGYKDVEVADLKDGQVGDLGWTLCPIERSADTKNSPVDIRLQSTFCLKRLPSHRGFGTPLESTTAVTNMDECLQAILEQYPYALTASFGHDNKCYGYLAEGFQDDNTFIDDVVCKIRDESDLPTPAPTPAPTQAPIVITTSATLPVCAEFDRTDDLEVSQCESIRVKDDTRACDNMFDNSPSRNVREEFCFVSQSSKKGWVEVSLAKTSDVAQVTILSKNSGTELPGAVVEVCQDDVCTFFNKIEEVDKRFCTNVRAKILRGNKVRVSIEGTALAICEMRIYSS